MSTVNTPRDTHFTTVKHLFIKKAQYIYTYTYTDGTLIIKDLLKMQRPLSGLEAGQKVRFGGGGGGGGSIIPKDQNSD